MSVKGLVFKSRQYIGSVQPPATVLEDVSRWRSNGVFLGSGEPDWVQTPRGLWVMDLDGNNDYVSLSANTVARIAALTSGTIIAWANSTRTSGDANQILSGTDKDDSNSFLGLYTYPTLDDPNFWGKNDNVGWTGTLRGTANRDNDGILHQYAVAVDSVAGGSIYVDGVKEGSDATFTSFFSAITDLNTVLIGASNKANTIVEFFLGLIGGITIFDYAFQKEQIQANYQADKHWYGR